MVEVGLDEITPSGSVASLTAAAAGQASGHLGESRRADENFLTMSQFRVPLAFRVAGWGATVRGPTKQGQQGG
jgi:hypothetical protein